jgi:hypothetical protein
MRAMREAQEPSDRTAGATGGEPAGAA